MSEITLQPYWEGTWLLTHWSRFRPARNSSFILWLSILDHISQAPHRRYAIIRFTADKLYPRVTTVNNLNVLPDEVLEIFKFCVEEELIGSIKANGLRVPAATLAMCCVRIDATPRS